jgi:hypothetical protein
MACQSYFDPGFNPSKSPCSGTSSTSAALTERHWQADIGMGYDLIRHLLQSNFGLRIAEVTAITDVTTGAQATLNGVLNEFGISPLAFVAGAATASNLTTVRRSFLGAGPRIGLEGSAPLIGQLAFDYSGDAAVLFGITKITNESTVRSTIRSPKRCSLLYWVLQQAPERPPRARVES